MIMKTNKLRRTPKGASKRVRRYAALEAWVSAMEAWAVSLTGALYQAHEAAKEEKRRLEARHHLLEQERTHRESQLARSEK